MSPSKLLRPLISAAAAAVLGGAGAPALAGNYMGSFDPMDFSGTYNVSILASCLVQDGWIPNDGSVCPLGDMKFIDATVNMVSDGTGGDPLYGFPPDPPGVLTFVPVDPVAQLLGILVENGEFLAPDTTLIKNTGSSPLSPDTWFLQLTSAQCGQGDNRFPLSCETSPGTPNASAVYTEFPICSGEDCPFIGPAFTTQQFTVPPGNAFIYVNGVPEPGTLALLAAALGGGWLARRRKTSAV